MALSYIDNQPVKFISGSYVGYDALNDSCNCFSRDFCQIAQRLDTTNFQVGLTAKSAELVTAGDFSTACGVDWTCGTDWNIAAGVATKVAGVASQSISQSICVMSNRRYRVTFDVDAISAGTITVFLGGVLLGTVTTTGTKTFWVGPVAFTDTLIQFTDVAGTLDATIDDVSVIEFSQLGYEIEDTDGNTIFTDVTTGVATYFEDKAQTTADWTQASVDGCYNICAHDAADYREMVCNGTFLIDAEWTLEADWTIAGGRAQLNTVAPSRLMTQSFLHPLIGGRCYTITFDILNYVSGTLQVATLNGGTNVIAAGLNANGSYSFPIDLTGLPNQITLRFNGTGQFDVDNVSITMQPSCYQEDACSECWNIKDTWDCSMLFSWTNDDNAFGFDYENLSFTQFFRHGAKLRNPKYPEQADRFMDSAGTVTVLYGISQKLDELSLDEMPEYLHDAFRLGVIHDTFTIDTVNFTKEEGDYEPQWRNSSLLAPIFFDVRQNGQDNENSNC